MTMLPRTPEPELMDEPAQARAYAEADFSEAHDAFVAGFIARNGAGFSGEVVDLGCGPCDVAVRFALALPGCSLTAVDGADAMLELARLRITRLQLEDRIHLRRLRLPAPAPEGHRYDAVISNSLLHHLADPATLWRSALDYARPGAALWVMDLLRPASEAELEALAHRYAADAPAVLRRDFMASLRAAYRVEEVRAQLLAAGLGHLEVRVASDRHLTVAGRLP